MTEEQHRLARSIEQHVQRITANGGGDEELLVSLYDHMGTFKQLMDISTESEMDQLCERYPGLYRFGKLLERLAEGIANGSIPVPK